MNAKYTVGIDFSMNSPAAAILNNTTKELTYINVFNTYKVYSGKKDYTREDYVAKYSPIYLLDGVEGINQILVREKRNGSKSEDYMDTMYRKFTIAKKLGRLLVDEIESIVGGNAVNVGFESYSYSSRTSSIIDIVEATMVTKMEITDRLNCGDMMYFVPPQTLKKWATGKGNAKKEQMFDFLVNQVDEFKSPLKEVCQTKKAEIRLLKKTKKSSKIEVLTPFDDLVDADFVCKYVYEKVKRTSANSSNA